jgi:RimJ/RimL family protein N-acetyltransferase
MQNEISSSRLLLNELSVEDVDFIFELVNSPDWLQFVGNRNVLTRSDAERLVNWLINNPVVRYWVVRKKKEMLSIGIVSFVKRDFLEHFDVGFAFLPNHTRQGFAREATAAFLTYLANQKTHQKVLATVLKENINSISLLEKLGFQFERELEVENELLQIYGISTNKFLINR